MSLERYENSSIHLGLDIGAATVKVAVINAAGVLVYQDLSSASKGPITAIGELMERLQPVIPLSDISTAGVTGAGRHLYEGQEGWRLFTSPYTAMAGLKADEPGTIIMIGGQSSQVVDPGNKEGKPWRFSLSPLCAAGTGKFLEQQSARLGIAIKDFGQIALDWTKPPPRIATRCSVFAKSDLIHLQQKGWPISAMLAGLSDSVARMIESQWREAFTAPIYLIGGVAANGGIVRALSTVLNQEIIVPTNYDKRGAIGAALLSMGTPQSPKDFHPKNGGDSQVFYIPNTLKPVNLQKEWKPKDLEPGRRDVYVGVDVGSTSTKAVVIDATGEVLQKIYLMTVGQPLEAIKKVMADLAGKAEGKVEVKAVGVTGSGRYLVGNFIGADLIKNEITAQTRAAINIDPGVETIVELGGQDSKYVYVQHGTILDYRMNKACAAGTGSFIDELAEQLEVSTRDGEFARLALEAKSQLDLGEKCTAFMGQAVAEAQQRGVPEGVITASLATSLVVNYLSKVAGSRIGQKILLTGAVFNNEAVGSAFKDKLPEHEFIIPEQKEVTGAIGAALLAKEAMRKGESSRFKGFSEVANGTYELSYFNCGQCEHNCAISMMKGKDGSRFYYGSRCDFFDAAERPGAKHKQPTTPFTDREALLFADYDPEKGTGPIVGIPRALMAYDLAPMLTGFLNALGVRVHYTSTTTKDIIEQSTKYAYPETCFPTKLLHGHVKDLLDKEVDFVLIPNVIRFGEKKTGPNQRFTCPLVQNAPYIVKSVFGLEDKLLDPIIDFSRGGEAVTRSFVGIAKRLGFSAKEGEKAIRVGLAKQNEFEIGMQEAGKKLLDELADNPDAIGVVLLSRSYNAQDSGANLGMAESLRKLGVIPIPLDYLPLDTVDISDVTDRPYWNYERKILAASKFIAGHPQLFGLFLSNFGCGPNAFIQPVVEDIMGDKPVGQLEVDEHAAEAGFITRLEALVDTIRSYRAAGLMLNSDPKDYSRLNMISHGLSRSKVFLPPMGDAAFAIAASMRPFGIDAQVLLASDEGSMVLSREATSGKECLPFRHSLGVFLSAALDGKLPPNSQALMAGAYGPCRLGKYAQEMQKILYGRDIDLRIITAVSDNSYADLGLGKSFELLAWKGIVATDLLQKMLWSTRPYEGHPGQADEAYQYFLGQVIKSLEQNKSLKQVMRKASTNFAGLRDLSKPRRPLVGINGEIYLRTNEFCNGNLVRLCEANDLEAEVSPMGEWIQYINGRRSEDAVGERNVTSWIQAKAREVALNHYERQIASCVDRRVIHGREPTPKQLIQASSPFVPSRNGSEAVLSIGSGVLQMRDQRFAGVASVMPHGCMVGGVVAALAEQISRQYGGKPWISLSQDGFVNAENQERVAAFAEQIRSQKS